MKHAKKLASLLLALVMVMGLATTAFAQEISPTDADNKGIGSITISNAAKGETYKLYRLFDATVSETQTNGEADSIAYTGTIPTSLTTYFIQDINGYITATNEAWKDTTNKAEMSEGLRTALADWAKTATVVASAVSDGAELKFTGLKYGYYVVVSTQGTAVSVDSTNPNATIVDKNSKEPSITKAVNDDNVYIGQTVTYTLTAKTANYLGEGEAAEIVTKYVIKDTLPEFLTDVTVTKIMIGETEYKVNGDVPQFDASKEITIPWATKGADNKYTSIYNNGVEIVITYTAKVTDKAAIDGNGNKNKVTLTPYTNPNDGTDTPDDPWSESYEDEEVIKTYAAALKKVDENKQPLAGAKFAANGLTVSGSKGNYTVTIYDPISTTQGTEMETDDNGQLIIKGLPSDVTLTVVETQAPDGYNKLTESISLKPTVISEEVTVTSTTTYYDENGNVTEETTETSITTITYNEKLKEAAIVVENKSGSLLPSIGGMGTTIFYVLGGILVVVAAVLLITKKRMNAGK